MQTNRSVRATSANPREEEARVATSWEVNKGVVRVNFRVFLPSWADCYSHRPILETRCVIEAPVVWYWCVLCGFYSIFGL